MNDRANASGAPSPPGVALVIPVRDASSAKSRLLAPGSTLSDAQRESLAAAISLDTVQAARAATLVSELVVVGSLRESIPGVRVVNDPGLGLVAAIEAALADVDPELAVGRAVLLGDLPALEPRALDAAVRLALDSSGRACVPDAAGTGTTFVIAPAGEPHTLRFGADSAQLHRAEGYRALPIPADSPLRRDVDTVDDLLELARLHHAGALTLGPRTLAALAAL